MRRKIHADDPADIQLAEHHIPALKFGKGSHVIKVKCKVLGKHNQTKQRTQASQLCLAPRIESDSE